MKKKLIVISLLLTTGLIISGCGLSDSKPKPRLSMFIGLDISGSFKNSQYYDDALDFMSYYIYCHLNGMGDLEVPNVLFVSSIGGAKADEPKTFHPKHTFENKSIEEIRTKLKEIFPDKETNPFTDYNAFFEQVAQTVKNRNLVLRPISVVMLSDGIPDVEQEGKSDYRSIRVAPLERLARNVTIRLLYTSAVVGKNWQTQVKRKRIKMWTQDAEVLKSWRDPKILLAENSLDQQDYFYTWMKENIDFGVRARRVD